MDLQLFDMISPLDFRYYGASDEALESAASGA